MKTLEEIKKERKEQSWTHDYMEFMSQFKLSRRRNNLIYDWIESTISQTKQVLIEEIRKAHPEWDADDLF